MGYPGSFEQARAAQVIRQRRPLATSGAQERVQGTDSIYNQIESDVIYLYSEFAPALFRFACSLAKERELARDALQESFLRYYVARIGGQEIRAPKSWLFRVLRNYLLDCIKISPEGLFVCLEDAHDLPDQCQDPESAYQLSEIRRSFGVLLSARESECLHLRAEGLRYREIAEILQIESGTVGSFLARALRKLRGVNNTTEGMR